MSDKEQFIYADREQLDAELMSAIEDIRSAEAEAKLIVEKAEASVKAVQLDGAARERALREQTNKEIAATRERAMKNALQKASAERAARLNEAESESKRILSGKRAQIDELINELYSSLTGATSTAKAPKKSRAKKAKE